MKATGIVRRIDELGRVVIPKEIRRVQHIRSGDSLEIFMEENGEVVFKKYSPLAELGEPAAVYADVLARRLGCGVLVCDREHIVAAAGAGKNELLHRELPPELDRLLKKRRLYTAPTTPDRRISLQHPQVVLGIAREIRAGPLPELRSYMHATPFSA